MAAQSLDDVITPQPSDQQTRVETHTLTNDEGTELRTMNYGAIILSLRVPDRDGQLDDVVLGFDDFESYRSNEYLSESDYLGAVIGRYSNRIDRGRFELDGKTFQLSTNNGPNHLHGGAVGFDKRFWSGGATETDDGTGVRYKYVSPAGEEGYPGRLKATVTYRLTSDNVLSVSYEATTTEATPVNLTQHSYFNLSGQDHGTVLDHSLRLYSSRYTPVDSTLIPTGAIESVDGTPLDFRSPRAIGDGIDAEFPQISQADGYDHNFVVDRENHGNGTLAPAAEVRDPESGRVLKVHTTEPGVQFYSGNQLSGRLVGKNGAVYDQHSGFCLETQHFPDSPNQSSFPSTILRPGETYQSETTFSFSVDR